MGRFRASISKYNIINSQKGVDMSKIKFISGIFLITVLLLSGCNLPSNAPATENPGAVQTSAALTVEALLNQPTPFNTPTLPVAPPTFTALPTMPLPTSTPFVAPTATATCDLAQFIKDVTIPDGTNFNSGDTFTKTWRLRNIGTCTWSGYSLVFDSGDSMNGISPVMLGTVAPGQEVDVSTTLKAPPANGTYRGYWRIRNGGGVLIPVQGGAQGKSFYVEIKVGGGGGSAGFDLHTQAPSAQWLSCGDPCGGATTLTFGGPDTDPNGFAMFRNNATLEDGSKPSKVVETHPMWVNDGVITGLYPAYTVQPGERFRAKIGFLGPCGSGNVIFQLNYKQGGTLHPLGSWTESCDGNLTAVNVDLSSIAGQTVQFVLGALANGSSGQDWAIWVSPRVEIP